MATPIITHEGNSDKLSLPAQLRSEAFKMFKSARWPAELDEFHCDNYDEHTESCPDREETAETMCPSCALLTRLMDEFNALLF